MTTQHTPGPWNIRRISRFHDGTPQDFDFLAVDSECGTRMSLQQGATGNFVANARLIAAAPELLSAVDSCLEIMIRAIGERLPINRGTECEETDWQTAIRKARVAIAKAEGLA